MFIILLKFSSQRARAGELLPGHKEWLARGFGDGVFLLAGTLQPDVGGGILAHGTSLSELRDRVDADPFVAAGVLSAEILEMKPGRADERLQFLLG